MRINKTIHVIDLLSNEFNQNNNSNEFENLESEILKEINQIGNKIVIKLNF